MNTTAYLAGLIERDDNTPAHVIETCRDWFNGKRSAMYRFERGQQVKPGALQREASKALSENNQGGAEDDRLKALRSWAIRQERLVDALQDLKEANAAFNAAVQACEVEPYYVARLWEAATKANA